MTNWKSSFWGVFSFAFGVLVILGFWHGGEPEAIIAALHSSWLCLAISKIYYYGEYLKNGK